MVFNRSEPSLARKMAIALVSEAFPNATATASQQSIPPLTVPEDGRPMAIISSLVQQLIALRGQPMTSVQRGDLVTQIEKILIDMINAEIASS
jgi:hypothetical protein